MITALLLFKIRNSFKVNVQQNYRKNQHRLFYIQKTMMSNTNSFTTFQ